MLRRRQFALEYAAGAQGAAETLAAAREAEVGRRDAFTREHGAFLPRGLPALSTLLQARPPYFEVSSNSSDSQLLALSSALSASVAFSAPPEPIGVRSRRRRFA